MRQIILVAGATGMLGEPVARQLEKDGYAVRVLARNPEKAKAKLGDSFEFVRGDPAEANDLLGAPATTLEEWWMRQNHEN